MRKLNLCIHSWDTIDNVDKRLMILEEMIFAETRINHHFPRIRTCQKCHKKQIFFTGTETWCNLNSTTYGTKTWWEEEMSPAQRIRYFA